MKHPNAASTDVRFMPANHRVFKRARRVGPVIYGPNRCDIEHVLGNPQEKLWQFDTLRTLSYLRDSENPTAKVATNGAANYAQMLSIIYALE